MKFLVLLAFVLVGVNANAWTDGTYKCRETTVEVSTLRLGDFKVPYMTISWKDGRQSGIARTSEVFESKSEHLILGNMSLSFENGALAKDWCPAN
jgi:hypothetical protein